MKPQRIKERHPFSPGTLAVLTPGDFDRQRSLRLVFVVATTTRIVKTCQEAECYLVMLPGHGMLEVTPDRLIRLETFSLCNTQGEQVFQVPVK